MVRIFVQSFFLQEEARLEVLSNRVCPVEKPPLRLVLSEHSFPAIASLLVQSIQPAKNCVLESDQFDGAPVSRSTAQRGWREARRRLSGVAVLAIVVAAHLVHPGSAVPFLWVTLHRFSYVSSLHKASSIVHRDVDVESFWSHVALS